MRTVAPQQRRAVSADVPGPGRVVAAKPVTEHRASLFSLAPRDADDRQVNRAPHARAEEADRGSIGAAGSCFAHDFSAIRVSTPAAASNASGPVRMPHAVFDTLRSPGHPLDAAARAHMEPLFGHDFSRVRVHVDASAAESAAAVGANAYTVGAARRLRARPVRSGQRRRTPAYGPRTGAHHSAAVDQDRAARARAIAGARSRARGHARGERAQRLRPHDVRPRPCLSTVRRHGNAGRGPAREGPDATRGGPKAPAVQAEQGVACIRPGHARPRRRRRSA